MIPDLILLGLVAGYFWKSVLVASAVGWPLVLVVAGVYANSTVDLVPFVLAASLLAVANTGVGVAINRGGAALLRRIRHGRETAKEVGG
jgi:hypothetical protein